MLMTVMMMMMMMMMMMIMMMTMTMMMLTMMNGCYSYWQVYSVTEISRYHCCCSCCCLKCYPFGLCRHDFGFGC